MNRNGPPILSQTAGAHSLVQRVARGVPFAAGKIGTSELIALWFYLRSRKNAIKTPYPRIIMTPMTVNAGLFPATDETLDTWAHSMLYTVLPAMDVVAEWTQTNQERLILNMVAPYSSRVPLRSLEPYYEANAADRWTYAIPEGATIAVVSPFAHSIQNQWNLRDKVWPDTTLWPSSLTLVPIQCGYGPALQSDKKAYAAWPYAIQQGGWQAAVDSIVVQVVSSGASLAMVGAGALSLPIVAALKKKGISAIHMGGAIQILFGIKGRRWLNHSIISTLFNDTWVHPLSHEIPDGASRVEEGCYW